MTGPWEETRSTGRLSRAGVNLVYETVEAVRCFDRFPPPTGVSSWTADAVIEFAHDFLYAEGGPERLAKLVAAATSEESFERVLEAAVRNEFRLQARRTDTGAALRALAHAVDQDGDIAVAGSTTTTRTWSLTEHAAEMPYSGPIGDLVEAAHAVEGIRQARWSANSARRAPIAEPESLRRIIHAVLERAAAPLSPQQMLAVILARFPLIVGGETELSDDLTPGVPPGSDAAILAGEMWQQLNDNERLVVGLLDLPVREMAAATGISRSSAGRAAASAREVLAALLADIDDPVGVVAALARASAAVLERGTIRAGSASTSQEQR